eukprot:TRINITY_DN67571_c7_g10_i1.p1 TRINITY_DN67571_c7_g10~~TRINITY_DN67571_c7_g10_i1.p1  ORF type:complete len:1088 (-),score=194.31 TRINITY_DN67571_c7_g10_i1:193-3186(-)
MDAGDRSMTSGSMYTMMTTKLKAQIESGNDSGYTTAAANAIVRTKYKGMMSADRKTPAFEKVGLNALSKVQYGTSMESPQETAEIEAQVYEQLKRTKYAPQLTSAAFRKEVRKAVSSHEIKKELDAPELQGAALKAMAKGKFKKAINNDVVFNAQVAKASGRPIQLALRKEINHMTPAEQQRFMNAVFKMMENTHGPETSEFFRLAGYHGWPGDGHGHGYCTHRQENFPGWHRIYLREFERALQAADRALGNDGNIGLPYWDWSDRSRGTVPAVWRNYNLPQGFFDPARLDAQEKIGNSFFTRRMIVDGIANKPPDHLIQGSFDKSNTIRHAATCLRSRAHWVHAQRDFNNPETSIEVSHDDVHGAMGYPMSFIAGAAFDIAFWLHHCNVDRIYEGYLAYEPDSEQEFAQHQRQRREHNPSYPDLYKEPLAPFFLPGTHVPFTIADTFDIRRLGYIYDKIPTIHGTINTTPKPNEIIPANPVPPPPPEPQPPHGPSPGSPSRPNPGSPGRPPAAPAPAPPAEPAPTMVVFPRFKITKLQGKAYQVHVFLTPKGVNPNPGNNEEDWHRNQYHAGVTNTFGRGPGCAACERANPIELFIDVSDALKKLRRSRYDVDIHGMCIDISHPGRKVIPLSETQLPQPIITGSLFEDEGGDVAKSGAHKREEATALQRYMSEHGYYEGAIDGDFGEKTHDAVHIFQQITNLKKDGVVGRHTKAQIKMPRYWNKDAFATGKPDPLIRKLSPAVINQPPIRYWVGECPGYIKRAQYISEIAEALRLWGTGLGWRFLRTKSKPKADLTFRFVFFEGERLFPYDQTVRGTTLARAKGPNVELDLTERWATIRGAGTKPGTFALFPVLLHCVGAMFGLQHSNNPNDTMYPYYNRNTVQLSENDRRRIHELYSPGPVGGDGYQGGGGGGGGAAYQQGGPSYQGQGGSPRYQSPGGPAYQQQPQQYQQQQQYQQGQPHSPTYRPAQPGGSPTYAPQGAAYQQQGGNAYRPAY